MCEDARDLAIRQNAASLSSSDAFLTAEDLGQLAPEDVKKTKQILTQKQKIFLCLRDTALDAHQKYLAGSTSWFPRKSTDLDIVDMQNIFIG